mmetsp:Transcript_35370/g.75402  ORF Transcript_35370/g.75402 Transcript_35370/m.75402 type:complete len:556 (+) Transcript_35370:109-1776(+)
MIALYPLLLLLAVLCVANSLSSETQLRSSSSLVTSGSFTENAICRQNNCINPVFPGLNDLPKLEKVAWQCSNRSTVSDYLGFCRDLVNYPPALPSPSKSTPLHEIVKQQDDAAATMFFFHLSGMGYEAGEHRKPSHGSDDCVKAVWKMVCYTYFPKAQAGCKAGEATQFLRPCRNSCQNYIQACGVECCDESVQCVFSHQDELEGGLVQTGYADAAGPSAVCTGSGSRSTFSIALVALLFGVHACSGERETASRSSTSRREAISSASTSTSRSSSALQMLSLLAVLVACSLCLQGCTVDVPHHNVGNWRRKSDYLIDFEFIEPGKPASAATLNSCAEVGVTSSLQCSGRGYCKAWNEDATLSQNSVSFCECEPGWADPECRTRRKSQITTFLLSLFGGFLGLDLFYLGFPWWGAAKLFTLGGCGFWWIIDVVRTGSGPVYASDFRVANDLPHWVFVLSTVTIFGFVGFAWGLESYMTFRKQKRAEILKFQEAEEAQNLNATEMLQANPRPQANAPHYSSSPHGGYGTLPSRLPSAGAPFANGQVPQGGGPYHYRP